MECKVLLIATCARSWQDLHNVAVELHRRDVPYFFLYNDHPEAVSPRVRLDMFKYSSNITTEADQSVEFESLGFALPFMPDVLVVTKESWEPEKSMIYDFKRRGVFITCVENSSWIYNNIKTKLEIASRKSFPTNCVDVFFDHSSWCKDTKKLAGWYGFKNIVVGNPKYDNLMEADQEEQNIAIVYGSMEGEHHNTLQTIYRNMVSKLTDWEIYYKPHPNEQKEFPTDFHDMQIVDHNNYESVLRRSKLNIGLFTSVMYLPMLLGKTIVYVDQQQSGADKELNIDNFQGHEFAFWKNILGFSTFEDFQSFISQEFIESTKHRNEKLELDVKSNLLQYDEELSFLGKKSNNTNLLRYYDDYNDGNASKRIVDFLQKLDF